MNHIHQVLFFILFGEAIYLLFLCIALLVWKLSIPHFRQRSIVLKARISRLIADLIENEKPFSAKSAPKEFSFFPVLLVVMESFDRRIQGSYWQEIKQAIGSQYLLPTARRLSKSIFWRKRNMAARAFSLISEKKDESDILTLIDDLSFLVRCFASSAAIHLESKNGIFKTLKHMIDESGYARYYYTDILLKGTQPVFSEILTIANQTKDPSMQLACSEILSKKTLPFPILFLRNWLMEKDPQIRLQALKILVRNPQENTEPFVVNALDDPDENIRAAAICCLEHFPSKTATVKLEKHLSDSMWGVRLQAAKLLKKIGKTAILERQNQTDARAYEVAQYALLFG